MPIQYHKSNQPSQSYQSHHSTPTSNYGRFGTMSQSQIAAWARKALSMPNLAILDTETTGQWRTGNDEIVEICLIDREGVPLLNTLVRSSGSIHPEATRVSGITDEMLLNAPRFSELASTIAELVNERGIVIYNAGYDLPLLAKEFQRSGLSLPACEVRCAMLAYAAYRRVPGRRPGDFKWHSLTDACAYEHISGSYQAHRALGDCHATRDLLHQMGKAEAIQ